MEATLYSETSVLIRSTWRHIPEHGIVTAAKISNPTNFATVYILLIVLILRLIIGASG
jgi:hypothetical protein